MGDQINISKPDQGVNTLVSELSLLRLEKTIAEVEKKRSKGVSEGEIRVYIDERHKDFNQRTRTQIYRLSLGLSPRDDFARKDLAGWRQIDDSTLEITLSEPIQDFQECSLVFFESQRWAVVAVRGATLVLKKF
jgi:hypothetical protein